MELTILHLYPDFMSLYGEYANVTVLRRRLEALGVEVAVRTACRADRPDFDGADMIYMGAGTERRQKLAMECLLPVRQELKDAADRGTLILFTGSAMEVLGASVTDAGGRLWQGLALADFTSISRYASFPTVSLEADRFTRSVAPAIAWETAGPSGIQISSHISHPTARPSISCALRSTLQPKGTFLPLKSAKTTSLFPG